jgi:hypothetical protein
VLDIAEAGVTPEQGQIVHIPAEQDKIRTVVVVEQVLPPTAVTTPGVVVELAVTELHI